MVSNSPVKPVCHARTHHPVVGAELRLADFGYPGSLKIFLRRIGNSKSVYNPGLRSRYTIAKQSRAELDVQDRARRGLDGLSAGLVKSTRCPRSVALDLRLD
jgi:hypothetical protein